MNCYTSRKHARTINLSRDSDTNKKKVKSNEFSDFSEFTEFDDDSNTLKDILKIPQYDYIITHTNKSYKSVCKKKLLLGQIKINNVDLDLISSKLLYHHVITLWRMDSIFVGIIESKCYIQSNGKKIIKNTFHPNYTNTLSGKINSVIELNGSVNNIQFKKTFFNNGYISDY